MNAVPSAALLSAVSLTPWASAMDLALGGVRCKLPLLVHAASTGFKASLAKKKEIRKNTASAAAQMRKGVRLMV